jgi:hypothetical protein
MLVSKSKHFRDFRAEGASFPIAADTIGIDFHLSD